MSTLPIDKVRAVVPGEEELGIQRRCPRCKESYPEDDEFFYTSHGELHSWCRACYGEYRAARYRRRKEAAA